MNFKTANNILQEYWDRNIPVDPFAIAKKMKVEVCCDPNLHPTSGAFQMMENGPVIQYNPNEPELRQRFTVAHELGHYVLQHGNAFRDTSGEFSTTVYDPKEIAANQFAAELLMPQSVVEDAISNKGITNIRRLANIFKVSEVAMQFRLKNLGWI